MSYTLRSLPFRGGVFLIITLLILAVAGCNASSSSSKAAGPDLTVTSVSGGPASAFPAGTSIPFRIMVTIQNRRAAISTPFRVGLYVSSDATIEPARDFQIAGEIISSMTANEERLLTFTGDIPPFLPGIYRVGAYADDDPSGPTGVIGGSVSESDEGNNSQLDPQELDVFFSTPAAPTIFLAEDTVLYSPGPRVWFTEGAIRLKWDAVPNVSGYHLYRDTSPITAINPGTLIADEGQLGGSALGAGFNIHAFIDGDSQTNLGATAIPTSGGPNLPAGTYYYKVFSVNGIGTPSIDGPEVVADHAASGYTPEDILLGFPGRLPPNVERLTVLTPTFYWSAATIPEIWTFTIGEPVIGVDPAWIHLVWPAGQSDVTLPYAAVGGFTAKDASTLQSGTVYTWTVIGYDSNGWGVIQGRPYSISIP
ncbi:MAG: hypothetical protein O7H41_09845 [Planctomycetota bacterium]|nr:hypothetical protein [Planctomycetota bacterium]